MIAEIGVSFRIAKTERPFTFTKRNDLRRLRRERSVISSLGLSRTQLNNTYTDRYKGYTK